jgi:hypothetical protein
MEGLRDARDSGATLSAEAADELKHLSASLKGYMTSEDMKSFGRCAQEVMHLNCLLKHLRGRDRPRDVHV